MSFTEIESTTSRTGRLLKTSSVESSGPACASAAPSRTRIRRRASIRFRRRWTIRLCATRSHLGPGYAVYRSREQRRDHETEYEYDETDAAEACEDSRG